MSNTSDGSDSTLFTKWGDAGQRQETVRYTVEIERALPSVQRCLDVFFQSVPPYPCIRMSKIASVIELGSRNRVSCLVPFITKVISFFSLLRWALTVLIGPAPIVSCMRAFKYLFTDIHRSR